MTHVRENLVAVVTLGLLGLATGAVLANWLTYRSSSATVTVTVPQRIGSWQEQTGCCLIRTRPEQWQESTGKRYSDGSSVVELQVLADVIGEGGVDRKIAAGLDGILYGHSKIQKYDVRSAENEAASDAQWRILSGSGHGTVALAYWFEMGRELVTNRTSLKIRSISAIVSGENNAAVVLVSSKCADLGCTDAVESISQLISELRGQSLMFTSVSTYAASNGSE